MVKCPVCCNVLFSCDYDDLGEGNFICRKCDMRWLIMACNHVEV